MTRSSNQFGPYQFPEKLIPFFVTTLLEGGKVPLYGDGLNVRDWLFVRDNCTGVDLVRRNGTVGEIYNIGAGNERTNREITDCVLAALGKDESDVTYVEDRLGHDRRYSIASDKVARLGWAPSLDFDDAIEDHDQVVRRERVVVAAAQSPGQEPMRGGILVTGSQRPGRYRTQANCSAQLEPRTARRRTSTPRCDVSDRSQALDLITTWKPEAIIHAAAFTAVDRCEVEVDTAFRANCLATRFVADGARRVGAHVVYISTDYVFDGTKVSPYVEWDLPSPRSIYGLSKLGGEREIDPSWTIARTSWVCGFHGNNMVKTVLRVAGEHDVLTFVDDQIGHPPSPATWPPSWSSSRSSGCRACTT